MSPIDLLLASKRSLASITHLSRANTLCTSTRQHLETTAILTARTSFLHSGISSQLSTLHNIHSNTQTTTTKLQEEFTNLVSSLDSADVRLRETLDALRDTIVEAGLRPEAEERRSLLDFVDEGGVGGLMTGIKEVIDEAGEGFGGFEKSNESFYKEILRVKSTLDDGGQGDLARKDKSPIPNILHEMENHARDMAGELEGLVRHYDMCVTAVKHTEGGSAAVSKIASDLPEGVDVNEDTDGAPPEPISEEQREEMMAVLEDDGEQVAGAVLDIANHNSDMEALYEQVETSIEILEKQHTSATSAFAILEDIGKKLTAYITQTQAFVVRWEGEKAKIEELLEEMEGLSQFYEGFLRAYDNLLVEIGRRKDVELRMEKEVQQARARLERLYDEDLREREAFSRERGDFLPVDIWPGLTAGPVRFEIGGVEEGKVRVPDIEESVIRKAVRRVNRDR